MCRFVLYHGPELSIDMLTTRPRHSIVKQSTSAELRPEPLNGDGFGVAWYAEGHREVARFRSVMPAWSNQNLQHLARVTTSKTILAHVRAASPGLPVVETNCHPFVCGQLSFMHNGGIPDFHRFKRAIQQKLSDTAYNMILGSTDSEHLFALCLTHLEPHQAPYTLEQLQAAMGRAIQEAEALRVELGVERSHQLNLVLSTGDLSVVSRYASFGEPSSLFRHDGAEYSCVNGVCVMAEADESQQAIIVASEPLSSDSGWEVVAANSIVAIGNGGVQISAI